MKPLDADFQRREMVDLLVRRGIRDSLVLKAMGMVERHLFVPESRSGFHSNPYGDYPVPIGYGQTISQPYIVAYMLERLQLNPGDRVLEIGSGSGYAAAVLDKMNMEVYAVELIEQLADRAKELLPGRVHIRTGDGYSGWPEKAPFDAIVVSCAPETVPEALTQQMKTAGRMIAPVGSDYQKLVLVTKNDAGFSTRNDLPVRFVPMVHP